MMMVNGVGAVLGSTISGLLITHYYTLADGSKNWQGIWICFASYSLVVAVLFALIFKHKHEPIAEFSH
jgi:NHS family xanthosine MFS transporter